MAASTAEPPVSRARRRHPDLLFEWAATKGHRWRLLFFLNLSLAMHVACFYAFKVVYPPAVRQRAETTKVTFLDPRDDPGVRAVIGRIEDRAIFFDGSLRLSVPGASLEDDPENEVVPAPGFASHKPALRIPPAIDFTPDLPRIFAVDDVVLPSRSRLKSDAEVSSVPVQPITPFRYQPHFVRSGEIADRKIVGQPDWVDSQTAFKEAVGNSIRFLIEVDEFGVITNCLPWRGVENSFDAAMARRVETGLRFAPSRGSSSGWLEMRW